jgi:hypothetical protein
LGHERCCLLPSKEFSETGQEIMSNIINTNQPAISAITEIELLCWKTAVKEDLDVLNDFISDCIVFELEPAVKVKTVEIRRVHNLKLPDAIIAATALLMDLTLITNDRRGFDKVARLKLFNPVSF